MKKALEININTSPTVLINFLKDPFNLRLWTVHRDLYEIEGACTECIITNNKTHFAEIKSLLKTIDSTNHLIKFSWFQNNIELKSFEFNLTTISELEVKVGLELPLLKDNRKREVLIKLINIEINLLKQYLENGKTAINKPNTIFLQSYHNNLSF